MKRDVAALALAYRDPRTPWHARLFSAAVVAYLLSPVDLIPDFIPVLGYLDDLVLIPLGIAAAVRMIPPEVMADARRKASEMEERSAPARYLFAALAVLAWVVVLAAAARAVAGLW
jgi:uncharacterized membrane protein YkvA (DUF1232 family)